MTSEKRNILTGGMILITLGVLIYLDKAVGGMCSFGQTWPVLIIVIGLCTIIQRFRDFGGWFITLAGAAFLIYKFYGFELSRYSQYILPAIIILLGIFVLLRRRKQG
jgi:hypothetical protein